MTGCKRRFSGFEGRLIWFRLAKCLAGRYFIPSCGTSRWQNLTVREAKYALYLRGFKQAPIEPVKLSDCDFAGVQSPSVIEDVKNIFFDNVRINGKLVS